MMPKKSINDIAVFGGSPAFKTNLYVGRPNIGNRQRFMARVNDLLDRRWLTNNGPFVQEFEHCLATMLDVKHVIAVCNATVALEIAIRALGLKGEVIVPSFTFVATAHALQWQEITPVFCDINSKTHNLDPWQVEALITPRTTGIIGVHVWGRPCDIEALQDIARRRNLKLMFDAAHAFGCSYRGKMIGCFGETEVFSFHATKFINSFEGGAIATNDDEIAQKIRLMQNFGFAGYDNVIYVGTNGKMSEISAAMGLTSLESMNEIIEHNRTIYQAYQVGFSHIPGLKMVMYDDAEKNNYQYIVVEVNEEETGLTRDQIVRILHGENVFARRYFYPGVHQMEPYRSYFPHARLLLPETERLVTRVVSFPTGTAVEEDDVYAICQIIRFCLDHRIEIRRKLVELH